MYVYIYIHIYVYIYIHISIYIYMLYTYITACNWVFVYICNALDASICISILHICILICIYISYIHIWYTRMSVIVYIQMSCPVHTHVYVLLPLSLWDTHDAKATMSKQSKWHAKGDSLPFSLCLSLSLSHTRTQTHTLTITIECKRKQRERTLPSPPIFSNMSQKSRKWILTKSRICTIYQNTFYNNISEHIVYRQYLIVTIGILTKSRFTTPTLL